MDAEARAEFWELAEQAKSRGRDLAEVLDRAGVLLTDERMMKIQADAIQEVAQMLHELSPHRLSRSSNLLDYQRDLAMIIQNMADNRRK